MDKLSDIIEIEMSDNAPELTDEEFEDLLEGNIDKVDKEIRNEY